MRNIWLIEWVKSLIDLEADILGSEDRFRYLIFIKCWVGLSGRLLKAINSSELPIPEKPYLSRVSKKQVIFWKFLRFQAENFSPGHGSTDQIWFVPEQAKSRNLGSDGPWIFSAVKPDIFRMRGYYLIDEVRNTQTKQYTRDVHRLSNSRRVLNSAYRSRNTADSLKTVKTPNKIPSKNFWPRIFYSDELQNSGYDPG